jgi:hypothetical protein
VLYPHLAAVAAAQPDGEISFPLTVLGPAAAGPYRLRRKIVKGGRYKNWRLNGEFIYDPEEQPGRFDQMRPGDLAVFGFLGKPAPQAVTLILLSQAEPKDAGLHSNLSPLVSTKSMVAISAERLQAALGSAGPSLHPLSVLARDPDVEEALEDIALGGAKGTRKLGARRAVRAISLDELRRAKLAADQLGADGEALVDAYLGSLTNPGGDFDYTWASASDAISPFDFRYRSSGGRLGDQDLKVDVKSTRGSFHADIHISIAELEYAAESAVPYLLFRVFGRTDAGGQLAISGDIRPFAQRLLSAHNGAMHSNICADSFSVPVSAEGLNWAPAIRITPETNED